MWGYRDGLRWSRVGWGMGWIKGVKVQKINDIMD